MGRYDELFRRSLDEPERFWSEAAEAIDWITPPERVLDDSRAPLYRWFAGGQLNTCYNALDRHVDGGRADQPALIYDSPVTDTVRRYTYRELRDEVARFAGALRGRGGAVRRPGDHLHADGPRGGDRDARLRPDRRGPLGRVRRVRRPRAGRADRRRAADGDRLGLVRDRAGAAGRLQVAAGRRDRAGRAQAAALHRAAAPAAGGDAGSRA